MSSATLERPAVLAVNPAGGSYDHEQFKEFKSDLANNVAELVVVETSPSRAQTAVDVHQAIRSAEGPAESDQGKAPVVVYGGDGTFRGVALGAAESGLKNSILPTKEGGTKCNAGWGFNPYVSPVGALKHGIKVQVPTLRTRWTTPEGKDHTIHSIEDLALGGAVTALEQVVERKPITRERGYIARMLDELTTTVNAAARHETFQATFADGRVMDVASLVVCHNAFFAGDGRMHVAATAPFTRLFNVPSEGKLLTVLRLFGLATAIYVGKKQPDGTSFTVKTHDQNPLKMQVDGEYEEEGRRLLVANGSNMTVDLDWDTSFQTLTTSARMICYAAARNPAVQKNLFTKLYL